MSPSNPYTEKRELSRARVDRLMNKKMQNLGKRVLLPFLRSIERRLHADFGDRVPKSEITTSLSAIEKWVRNLAILPIGCFVKQTGRKPRDPS